MEIKKGDKVRVSSRVPRIYERFGSMIAPHYECKVVEIDDGMALLDSIPAKHIFLFPLKYLIKVDVEAKEAKRIFYGDYAKEAGQSLEKLKRKAYPEWYSSTKPTEQAEAEEEPCVGHINFAERIKRQQEAHQAIVDEFRSRSFDWDAYTADLAKELAISYAKRGKSPLDAVAAAKEIVKRLKQK